MPVFGSVLLPRFKIVNGADHFENVHRGTDIVHNILHLLIGHRTFIQRIFTRPDGRFMLTMGNGSTSDWKQENLKALYEASLP